MEDASTNLIRSKFEQQTRPGDLRVITPKEESWVGLVLPTINTINELQTHLQTTPTKLVYFKNEEGVKKEVILERIRRTGTTSMCRVLWSNPIKQTA